jgi:uncharacterized protein (TIGR02271 family)
MSDLRAPSGAPRTDGGNDFQDEQTLELREEQLVAHKELQQAGEITVRTQVDQVPGRLEVDAFSEEVEVKHEPVGQVVGERRQPWEEDGTLVVPVYEEQLVVTKRLVLREHIRIRRVATTQRQLFEDTLLRERLVIDDPQHTGLVHELYPTDEQAQDGPESPADQQRSDSGFLEQLARKALE